MTTPDQSTTEVAAGTPPPGAAPLVEDGAPPTTSSPSASPVPQPTRAGRLWLALAPFAIVLALVLVFILQNGRHEPVRFLAWSTDLPLGVALHGAAVLGALAVFCLGSIRMIQLRAAARRGNSPS